LHELVLHDDGSVDTVNGSTLTTFGSDGTRTGVLTIPAGIMNAARIGTDLIVVGDGLGTREPGPFVARVTGAGATVWKHRWSTSDFSSDVTVGVSLRVAVAGTGGVLALESACAHCGATRVPVDVQERDFRS